MTGGGTGEPAPPPVLALALTRLVNVNAMNMYLSRIYFLILKYFAGTVTFVMPR